MGEPVVGIIGCGKIGRFHGRHLAGIRDSGLLPFRMRAVADPDVGRADAVARETGAETTYSSGAALLDDPSINTVYVCTETAGHPGLVREAVARGMNILCQKPLATTLADAARMAAAVAAAGVVHQVGLILRATPVLTVLHELISERDHGPLLTAHLRDDQRLPIGGRYGSGWRGNPAISGGGTLIEHSIHDVDILRWFFGDVEAVRCHTHEAAGFPGIEDVASATFQHAGGRTTALTSVWHRVAGRRSTRRFEIFFERGWFMTDHDFLGPISLQLDGEAPRTLRASEVFDRFCDVEALTPGEAVLAREGSIADYRFLQAVQSGAMAHPDFGVAHAAHVLVDACYQSARNGREIRITDV